MYLFKTKSYTGVEKNEFLLRQGSSFSPQTLTYVSGCDGSWIYQHKISERSDSSDVLRDVYETV